MCGLIEKTLNEWNKGENAIDRMVSIYHKIREIPYAIIPDINDTQRYVEILRLHKGSCMPKHFLLCNMYQRLGMFVLYAVYPFRWDEVEIDYPPSLKTMAKEIPMSHHLACLVDIDGGLVLVDATLDTALKTLGLPVNEDWDGAGDTVLPVVPCDEEQLYYPSEAKLIQARYDDKLLRFYSELNRWLDNVRRLPT